MTALSLHAHREIDAERSVLGGILVSCEPIPPALSMLSPADFGHPVHQRLFSAMLTLDSRREPIDLVTVAQELRGSKPAPKEGWTVYLATLAEDTPTAANVVHWAGLVRREARRRDCMQVLTAGIEQARREGSDGDQVIAELVRQLGLLAAAREISRPVSMRELISAEYKAIERRGNGEILGLPTGFDPVDRLMGGLEPSGFVIVAGRPMMGKSALAAGVLQNIAIRRGGAGLTFSLEMSKEQQVQRALASEGRVDLNHIRQGRMDAGDWPKLAAAAGLLATDKIHVCDTATSITEICAVARAHAARQPISLVVIDYLQLVAGEGDNREQEVASVSRRAKALAMELRIPVIGLAQLNREVEKRNDKRPMLSDLRESGSLEQDADQVLLLYRDEYYNPRTEDRGVAEVNVAKNRNGPIGTVKLRWTGRHTRFDSLENEQHALPIQEQPF